LAILEGVAILFHEEKLIRSDEDSFYLH